MSSGGKVEQAIASKWNSGHRSQGQLARRGSVEGEQ